MTHLSEVNFIRAGYMILLVTLLLMTWAYLARADPSPFSSSGPSMVKGVGGGGGGGGRHGHGSSSTSSLDGLPPCSFNPLCTCSNPGPTDWGIISCHSIPFGTLPHVLVSSRAFMLSMIRNQLQVLEGKRLIGSGLWRLEVKDNDLSIIEEEAFAGLEKSLWELDLEGNELTSIPTSPLKRLMKLRLLNLGNNRITDLSPDDFQGLQGSLKCLSLAGNMLVHINQAAFGNLPLLERLDLSRNRISSIHPQAFISSTHNLHDLLLSNNLLTKIPFEALGPLALDVLDLNHNLITSLYDSVFYQRKILVQTNLDLGHNQIRLLEPFSFQNINAGGRVTLSFNPLTSIDEDGFKEARVKDLDLSHCYIHSLHPRALNGLQTSLETLDLSSNNLTLVPHDLFQGFERILQLNFDENRIRLEPGDLDELKYTLQGLSLVGDQMEAIPLENISRMRNVRSLSLSHLRTTILTPDLFQGFGPAIESIRFSRARIASIRRNAFMNIPSVKRIDLSENRISRIEDEAFDDVGHSLLTLKLNSALRMTTISPRVFEKLSALRDLDLSNNALTSLQDTTFLQNQRLVTLNLRFNRLSSLASITFDSSRLPHLQSISLAFNNLKVIPVSTFSRLKDLETLDLNENQIKFIEPRAFVDLSRLRVLNLAGNSISALRDETFQNLPNLIRLDLSHNLLRSLNINAFEQLGTLSQLTLDLSYNQLDDLDPATSTMETSALSSSSIEYLDLSYNYIETIPPAFFSPISNTLISLDLSHNNLRNLTRGHLAGMTFLQSLTLSHNQLDSLEYNSLHDSKSLQVMDLTHNALRDIPPDLFENSTVLRVFSAGNNLIRNLNFGFPLGLESLKMSGNGLVRFPEAALTHLTSSLVNLDLSWNEISSLAPTQIESLTRLRVFSLAHNRIVVISDTALDPLQSLLTLDLSGNPLGRLPPRLFDGLRTTLQTLHLSSMALDSLPDFDLFPKLTTFNVSGNSLVALPTNFGVNMSSLRVLDLSSNQIPFPPNTIWHTIPRLTRVLLRSNPIQGLSGDSFLQLDRLQELDISELPLETIQSQVFSPLGILKKLTLGPLEGTMNPGVMVQSIESLESLHLKLEVPKMTNELSTTPLPPKLTNVTISGSNLQKIGDFALQTLTGRALHLTLENTALVELSKGFLHNLGCATQLSIRVRGNNSLFRLLGNPNPEFRPEPFVTFLEDLDLNPDFLISCTCDSGWIEFWLRHWMDQICPIGTEYYEKASMTLTSSSRDESNRCYSKLRDLRLVPCREKLDHSLLQAFVSELECGWESRAAQGPWSLGQVKVMTFGLTTLVLIKAWI